MTVYAKIENNKLICASNNLGITGLADSPSLCEANGFTNYTEEEVSGYYCGTHQIIDGALVDITDTPEYIAEQKAKEKAIQKAEILKQIDELEQSQARAIREIALNKDTSFAMGKLQLLDEQITELRGQLNA